MIYEFALEPALVASWHDRKEYIFFEEKFGLRSRRVVSAYPKNWKKLVWRIFESGPAANDQNAKMRMTELIQFLWQNAIKRSSSFPEIAEWLKRAEAEQSERPFHAIIATVNPRHRCFVISAEGLIANGHKLWPISDQNPTRRTAEGIAKSVLQLLKLCSHAVIIDPYFDPNQRRFRASLREILNNCNQNVYGLERLQLELHTSIERCFKHWERGDERDPADEALECQKLTSACQRHLPELIPTGIKLKVVIWKQKDGGEKLHNRYILTNICGVIFGTGSDETDNPDAEESDDIVLLDEGQYCTRYKQYSSSNPAFDMVSEPIFIVGKNG